MYIRTKDGVYEVSSKQKNTYYVLNGRWQFEKQDIINQSENLEELCDEFVTLIQPDNYEAYGSLLSDYDDMVRLFKKYPKNIFYGAIWTEWGLKYVAKMNDKGKLELI